MKNLIYSVILLLLFATSGHGAILAGYDNRVSGATDYTQYVHCMGAWLNSSATTTEADVTGNGETGTYVYTPSQVVDDESGWSGYGVYAYVGAGNRMIVPTGGEASVSGASAQITLYVKIKPVYINDCGEICSRLGGGGQSWILRMEYNGTIYVAMRKYDNSENVAFVSTNTLSTGSLYRVFVVQNGATLKLYVNGVEWGSATYTYGIYDCGENIKFMGLGDYSYWFKGNMYECAIFDTALTTDQMTEISTYGIDGKRGAND